MNDVLHSSCVWSHWQYSMVVIILNHAVSYTVVSVT